MGKLDKRDDSMHDGGSITGELRAWWVRKFPVMDKELHKDFTAIADRIDAEHESACAEAYGNGVMSVPIALDESQWVKLPVDADGVPIRVGDVMVYADNTIPKVVVALVPPSVFMVEDGPRFADMCRHYHAPTVEDVLTKFGIDWEYEDNCEDRAALLAEYAAKLRLAGDAE